MRADVCLRGRRAVSSAGSWAMVAVIGLEQGGGAAAAQAFGASGGDSGSLLGSRGSGAPAYTQVAALGRALSTELLSSVSSWSERVGAGTGAVAEAGAGAGHGHLGVQSHIEAWIEGERWISREQVVPAPSHSGTPSRFLNEFAQHYDDDDDDDDGTVEAVDPDRVG